MRAIDEVHYNGTYWRDIDWSKPIHHMSVCDECGSDGAEGHQNACRYLYKNQETPAGRTWIRGKIKEALDREAGYDASDDRFPILGSRLAPIDENS